MDVLWVILLVGILFGVLKICVMEIIDELELVKCGVYGGVVGYLVWNGNMDIVIVICIVVIKNGEFYVQVGGGIVVDLVFVLEWEEIINKCWVMFCVVVLVEQSVE